MGTGKEACWPEEVERGRIPFRRLLSWPLAGLFFFGIFYDIRKYNVVIFKLNPEKTLLGWLWPRVIAL